MGRFGKKGSGSLELITALIGTNIKEGNSGKNKKKVEGKKIACQVSGDGDQAAHYCTAENHVVVVIATEIAYPNMRTHTHTHTSRRHASQTERV